MYKKIMMFVKVHGNYANQERKNSTYEKRHN